jgi:hypothetical protein
VATQEAEIRKIVGWSQPGQIVGETLSQKNPSQKKEGGVAQGVGPKFKPQYHKKQNKTEVKDLFQLGKAMYKPLHSAIN